MIMIKPLLSFRFKGIWQSSFSRRIAKIFFVSLALLLFYPWLFIVAKELSKDIRIEDKSQIHQTRSSSIEFRDTKKNTDSSLKKLNILWLIAEDMSPDLGCYGVKEVSTPNLDQLAKEGMRWTNVYTTAPVCSASRSAFCTGMYQTTIGAHHHRSHRDDGYKLPEGVQIISDYFRNLNYFTADLITMPAEFKFRGEGKTDWNFFYPGKPFDSTRWDDLKPHQPFYAQINFQETHRAFKAPKHADRSKLFLPPIYPDHPVAREDWGKYLDAATELDRKIGLIIAQLKKEGLWENTIVLFMSDHGEAHVRAKQFCYDDGLRIPLIIRWPDSYPVPKGFKKGEVSNQLISAIDLLPTFYSLVGGKKPAMMQGQIFLGDHQDQPRKFVFSARDRCDETTFRFRTVRDQRYRYIRNFMPERPFMQSNHYKEGAYPVWNLIKQLGKKGELTAWQKNFYLAPQMEKEELYDLENDPWEMTNLVNQTDPPTQKILNELRQELETWIRDSKDQGEKLEPIDLAKRQGVLKKETHPLSGYRLKENGEILWMKAIPKKKK